MLINLRNALMAGKRLPYDAEVEYLESTGTQWVDIGIVHDQTFRWECDAEFTSIGSTNRYVGQTYKTAAGGGKPRFAFGSSSARLWYAGLGNLNADRLATADTDRHVFVLDAAQKTFQIDGNTFAVNWSSFSLPTYVGCGLGLFGRSYLDTDGEVAPYCQMRMYSSKHYRNGVLVRDYIPVRVGTVGYMYDRVTGRLFGNAGTGDFVLGQDVVPVEYIESHGTEWIDTGVQGTDSLSFKVTYRRDAFNSGRVIFGVGESSVLNYQQALMLTSGGNNIYYIRRGNAAIRVSIPYDTDWHTFYVSKTECSIDDVSATGNMSATATTNTLKLFATSTSTTITSTSGLISDCQVWEASVPVRSFRAVRVGTEGAMMDVLTRRIYRNDGTGAFTYGNDLKYPIPAE